MQYPLTLHFKLLALASQIYIRDSRGELVGYVKQKLLKLKEEVQVFADEQQTRLLFSIKADRIIDFSARYHFTDAGGRPLGSVKRNGMRSLWRASYEVADASGGQLLTIREESAWIKVLDGLVGEIPVVGIFTGYFLNPSYLLSRGDGAPVARLKKTPALFEGKFALELLTPCSEEEQNEVLLGFLMMLLLERTRG